MRPAVKAVKSGALLAIVLAAASAGSAWGQSAAKADPYAHYGDSSFWKRWGSGAGQDGDDLGLDLNDGDLSSAGGSDADSSAGDAPGPVLAPMSVPLPSPNPPAISPYGGVGDASAGAYDPLKPPRELSAPSFGAATNPSGLARTGAQTSRAADNDPLAASRPQPYDANAILAPPGQSPLSGSPASTGQLLPSFGGPLQ